MAENKKLQKNILKISEGVLSTAVDTVLWFSAFSAEMVLPQRPYGAAARASYAAGEFLEKVNYHTIKNAVNNARRKGWIKNPGQGKKANLEITATGKKRLKSLLPFYDEKRAWDKRIYLITYDIAEKQRKSRDILRKYLKKIGCGMLQQSVWITPYNPCETLKEFIKEKDLKGAVIISDIGKDGSIGEEDIKSLVFRVYNLEKINNRYEKFLEENSKENKNKHQILFSYLSILQDDPQLPFELLPRNWLGEKAYEVYKNKVYK